MHSNSARLTAGVLFVFSILTILLFPGATQTAQVVKRERSERTKQLFETLIARADAEGPVRVIVGVEVPFTPEGYLPDDAAREAQRAGIARAQESLLERLQGVRPDSVKRFEFIPYVAVEIDATGMRSLHSAADVISLEEDVAVPPALAESTGTIGAQVAWASGFSGQGQTIAILDTGVDRNHPFLAGKVVSEACYSSDSPTADPLCPGGATLSTQPGSAVPCLECDHGTHVAGIAAGRGTNYSGVARDANLIAIQVFHRENSSAICDGSAPCLLASITDQISALNRVHALTSQFQIAAVNMSLGGGMYTSTSPCDSEQPSRKAAIDNLASLRVATVVSSGNKSYTDALGSPACISSAISVGSTDDGSLGTTKDAVSAFSNSASFLDLLAPGRWIRSSVPGGGDENKSGTSMAAPHVAGAWAVIKSRIPSASVEQVKSALATTGTPIRDGRNGITRPRIQLDAAVSSIVGCAYEVTPSAQFISAQGGTVNVVVSSPSNCSWNVISDDSFITVQSALTGKGNAGVTLQVSPNNTLSGRVGSVTVAGKEISISQVNSSSACADRAISFGQPITSSLNVIPTCSFVDGDDRFYTHVYAFTAQSGTPVAISLRSSSFDARLVLVGPDGVQLREDDDGGGSTDARIPPVDGFLILPASGYYRLIVTTAQPYQAGSYTLSVNSSCSYSVATQSANFSASGGSGQLSISTGSNCPWSVASTMPWITVTSSSSGSGNGVVSFSVAANTSPGARTANLTVGNQTVTITQQSAAVACSYGVSPLEIVRGSGSSTEDIGVTTPPNCGWGASSNAGWITLVSGSVGNGNGTVRISLAANATGARRTGTVTVASQTVNVVQESSACLFTLSTTSPLFTNAGGNGVVNLTTSAGCIWTARSNAPWLRIMSASNGSGSALIGYSVLSNTSLFDRTGTLEIGGSVLTIRQMASSSQVLVYHGRLRDRVGAGDAALAADGSADATFQLRNPQGSGHRTITRLVLSRSGGGTWDTVAGNGQYVLGVSSTIDGVLRNQTNGTVSETILDGGTIWLFAADFSNLISAGTSHVLTITYSTGPASQVNLTVPMNALPPSMAFAGKTRDLVGRGELASFPDGDKDGAFTLSFPPGGGQRVVSHVLLSRDRGGVWDTNPGNGSWLLGVASSPEGIIINRPNGTVDVVINEGSSLTLFGADSGGLFIAGDTFSITITFADGSVAIAQGQIPAGSVTPVLTFTGLPKDVVGRGESALSADGSMDGAFLLQFPDGGGFGTISKMTLIRDSGGAWDTVAGNGRWVLGYADSSSSTSLRNAANGTLQVTVPDGGSAVLYASDNFGLFSTGIRFTLVIEFTDSSSAIARTSITGLPPELAFRGRLRDRVGQGDLALASDGQSDAVFAVTLPLGNGARTVSRMTLSRTGGGVWDTVGGNGQWALGAADSIDGALRNSSDSSVNFVVPDGGGFALFASDNGALFGLGSVFTLSVTFSDGQTMTGSTTVALIEVPPLLTFNGLTLDRVGRGDAALQPDGSPDGAFSLSFPSGTGDRTITRLQLVRTHGGAWDTVPTNGLWVAGVANSAQPSTLRNASDGSLNLAVRDGDVLSIFVSDNQNLFATGSSFIVTFTYADGGTATATVTIGAPGALA